MCDKCLFFRCCMVTQDRRKTAKIMGWPNVGQANVGVEAPIKELPMDSTIKLEQPRISRRPLNGGFRPNAGLADVGPRNSFCLFSTILSHCAPHSDSSQWKSKKILAAPTGGLCLPLTSLSRGRGVLHHPVNFSTL